MGPTVTLPRLVYILGDGSLFDEVIAGRLALDASVRVNRYLFVEEASLLADARRYHPGVIVVNESALFSFERIVMMLSQLPLAAEFRIIVTRVTENAVEIYDRRIDRSDTLASVNSAHVSIGGWSELFDLIEGRQVAA